MERTSIKTAVARAVERLDDMSDRELYMALVAHARGPVARAFLSHQALLAPLETHVIQYQLSKRANLMQLLAQERVRVSPAAISNIYDNIEASNDAEFCLAA